MSSQLIQEYTTYFTPKKLRVLRNNFMGQGVDNFTQPPAQDPNSFIQLTNVMPFSDNIVERRWGYTLWTNTPLLQAQHIFEYQSVSAGLRYILQCAADGTGVSSATNKVEAYSEAGVDVSTVFVPATGATKPYMVLSRDFAFFTDGVTSDLQKWNGSILTKWGIEAPTAAPALTAQSGTAYSWQANTEFWTIGIFVDPNNNAQQLISVNAKGDNPGGVFGSSGPGQPAWNQTKAGTTTDGTVTWTNVGQITLWQPNMTVTYRQPIYDPDTGGLFVQFVNTTTTTGTVKPNFNGVDGTFTIEKFNAFGQAILQWGCIGNISTGSAGVNGDNLTWQASTGYNQFDHHFAGVVEPQGLPATVGAPLPTTPIYLQLNITAPGTTGTGSGNPPASLATLAGQTTNDGQLTWLCLGSAVRANNTPVTQFTSFGNTFTCIKDGAGNLQVCSTSGTTAGAAPTFATAFGATTADGTAVWTCLGPTPSWAASTQFFLPNAGWVIPTQVITLGGSEIVVTISLSKFEQFVTASGKSGATAPAFSSTTGVTTTDNTVTWTCGGPFVAVAGDITLTIGAFYFVVFRNATTGHLSDLSPVSAFTGPLTGDSVVLANIPVSSDSQVTDVIILRTADGGDQTTLYFVGAVPNGTTSFTDNVSAQDLLNNNIYQETDQFGNLIGVANNALPPNGSHPIYHRGRLYMLVGNSLFFSKSLQDLTTSTGLIAGRFEECWPAANQLLISSIAETPRGLLSDGLALYIGTERQVHRLLGDGPSNFSQPEIVFDKVGILNEETIKPVFVQGSPSGIVWLTPDNRVIASDFNTYIDVGHEIQTTLNGINAAAGQNAWAMFVSQGPFDLYLLFIPTGANTVPDTCCVYNLRSRKWVIWQLTDASGAGVFNINASGLTQWIISAASGVAYKFISTGFQDRQGNTPASYPLTLQTSWFSPYDFSIAKAINELKILTDDAAILITLEGARSSADFATPNVLINAAAPTTNAFGDLMYGLVSQSCKYQYFRLTATATSTVQAFLRGYSFEVIPLSRV